MLQAPCSMGSSDQERISSRVSSVKSTPRVTQRGHGAAIAPTLPVRCDPIRELLALSPAFPGEESAQRLLVIILHERGTDGHMVPTVIRLEIQHRVGQPVTVRHGLSANGNDHVHIMVQLAADDGWINPYRDRINAQRSCRRMEKSRPELVGLARSDTGTRVTGSTGNGVNGPNGRRGTGTATT